MLRFFPICLAALLLGGTAGQAQPSTTEPLVADLSDHLIAITTGFTGRELLLFGATDGDGEVVVVIHGPREEVVVRRKERIAGIWMNRDSVSFRGVPAYYHAATTVGAALELPLRSIERHQIGVDYLRMEAPRNLAPDVIREFRQALIRNKQRDGLYSTGIGVVDRRGARLFRTDVFFPANVPTGTYVIETLLIRQGEVVSAQTTPLFINKVGAGAQVYRMAHEHPAFYGIAAVIIAVVAGLGANWVFQRLG